MPHQTNDTTTRSDLHADPTPDVHAERHSRDDAHPRVFADGVVALLSDMASARGVSLLWLLGQANLAVAARNACEVEADETLLLLGLLHTQGVVTAEQALRVWYASGHGGPLLLWMGNLPENLPHELMQACALVAVLATREQARQVWAKRARLAEMDREELMPLGQLSRTEAYLLHALALVEESGHVGGHVQHEGGAL